MKYNEDINKLYKKIEVTKKPKYLLQLINEIKKILIAYFENITNISEIYNSIIKTRKIIKMENSKSELEKKIRNFEIEVKENELYVQKMKEENKKLESQNLNLKKKINIKNEEIKSSQSNFDILFSKFENLEKLNKTVIEKNNKLENEIQTLKSNNNKL